ncbi:hypothetical protein SCLCIDRAFT_53641, partial [Scleroderma citrinum Foug A]
MQPKATKIDIPSTHNVYTYIYNTFGEFIKELRSEIQSTATGRVSTTMDNWSIQQTKASFIGITAH